MTALTRIGTACLALWCRVAGHHWVVPPSTDPLGFTVTRCGRCTAPKTIRTRAHWLPADEPGTHRVRYPCGCVTIRDDATRAIVAVEACDDHPEARP